MEVIKQLKYHSTMKGITRTKNEKAIAVVFQETIYEELIQLNIVAIKINYSETFLS